MRYQLNKGFKSLNGQVEIYDYDSLCYIVKNNSRGSIGLRTISKDLLNEYVDYFEKYPDNSASEARDDLSGKSLIDKFEYGYTSTLMTLAKMVLGEQLSQQDKDKSKLGQAANHTSLKPYLYYLSQNVQNAINNTDAKIKSQNNYLRAMRTKPFLLLAGISGTGKSRIVKQMAFDSCPDKGNLQSDATSPGNYCLIEVKPNWHDSTELLGYESKIGGAHYQLTPFVKFLAKAMLYPDVPFFVCLDEMNLAPVEQYFAEFLSVLESRNNIDGHIVTEPLIKADIFKKYALQKSLFSKEEATVEYAYSSATVEPEMLYGREGEVYEQLKKNGLRIPENVIVIGTVNMDETTHQFSRKVIDRAMTIEMNLPEGNPFMDFFNNASELEYRKTPVSPSLYLATETKASDVIKILSADDSEKAEILKEDVAKILTGINNALEGTPFKVAYRVQNELILYFYQLWLEDKNIDWTTILNTAMDQILMMKVLPRVEGDEELLEKPLDRLIEFSLPYPNASKKLNEMRTRLDQSRFTSFWP